MTRATPFDLNPNEYNQGFHYYLCTVNLVRYNGCFNTLNDPSDKISVPNKTKNVNVSVSNVIAKISKSKTLTKHMSWKC